MISTPNWSPRRRSRFLTRLTCLSALQAARLSNLGPADEGSAVRYFKVGAEWCFVISDETIRTGSGRFRPIPKPSMVRKRKLRRSMPAAHGCLTAVRGRNGPATPHHSRAGPDVYERNLTSSEELRRWPVLERVVAIHHRHRVRALMQKRVAEGLVYVRVRTYLLIRSPRGPVDASKC